MQPQKICGRFLLATEQQIDQGQMLAAPALRLIAVDRLSVFHQSSQSI